MKDIALTYLRGGLSVVPANKAQKCPVLSWKPYQQRLPTEAEWKNWYIDDALFIICGAVSGNLLVFDFDQQGKVYEDFKSQVPAELFGKLVIETTQSGGKHILLRTDFLVAKGQKIAADENNIVLVETRGEGQGIICAPSPGYELIQNDFQTIPVLTEQEVSLLWQIAAAFDHTPAAHQPTALKYPPLAIETNNNGKHPADDYNIRGKEHVRQTLKNHGWTYVRNAGENDELWKRPGDSTQAYSARLHNTPPCLNLFSPNAPPFIQGRPYNYFAIYATLEHGGNHAAATKALAQLGYGEAYTRQPVELPEFITDSPSESDDDSHEEVDDCPENFPKHLLNVPGFVGELAQYINSVSHVDQPTYALAAALAFQALLCAQNVKDPTGIRTNPYIIVAGRSASGKDKGREVIKKIFTQLVNTPKCKLERHYKPLHHFIESVASYQALIKRLKRNHGVLLWLWDELGKELASWTKDRSANLSGVKTELMRLYTSADSIYVPHAKASSDPKEEEADAIQQPNLVLYGTAESETLFNAFSISELTDGLVGRLMIFEGNDQADRTQQTKQIPIPESILETTDWWLEKRVTTINQEIPKPVIVPVTDEAEAVFEQFLHIQKQLQYDRVKTTLWGRAQQQARQFALIYACSANKDNPVIDKNAAEWAYELVSYLIKRKIHIADRHVADSEFDRQQKEILRYIESCGGICFHTDLYRKFQRLEKRRREDIIINLEETGAIKKDWQKKKNNRQVALCYVLIKRQKRAT